MINRAILARVKARQEMSVPKEAKVVTPKAGLLTKKVVMKDPETLEVVEEFESVALAVEKGFRAPNIAGALKNGNKYKGHLWAEIED